GAPPQVGGLRNAQLLHDLRHRTTLFSGARNELMPPWLRWRWPHRPFGQPTQHLPFLVWLEQRNTNNDFDRVEANFLEQANTKLDLRERRPLAGADPNGGSPEFIPGNGIGYRWLHERLPWVLMDALTDGSHRGRPAMPGYIPGTRNYFPMPPVSKATWYGGAYTGVTGPPSSPAIDKIRRMAAAYSANILAIRDADSVAPVGFEGTLGQAQAASRFYPYSYFDGVPGAPARPSPGPALEWIDHDDDDTTPVVIQPGAIPLPQWGEVAEDRDTRFLGMEIQPFLVEAFIGHVYKTWEVPDESFIDPHPSSVLLKTDEDGAEMHSSVFVVQIANPYDQPIDFFHNAYKYELEAFGEVIDIREAIEQSLHRTELALAPARSNRPSTMILYAIGSAPPDSGNFRNQMIDFLDLKPEDHPVGTYLINIGPLASDLTERDTYEGADVDEGIRLIRTELLPQPSGPPIGIGSAGARVVIDRFNNEELEDALNGQATALTGQPPTYTDSGLPDPLPDPGTPEVWPGVAGGWEPNDQAQTHWMQWARISRAWGNEYDDGDGFAAPYASPVERNPRYIFATSVVTTARDKTSDTRANYATRVYPTPAAPPTESWPGNSFTLATSPDIDTGGEGGLPWITIDYPVIRLCRLTDGTCVELSAYECERVPIPNGGPGVSLDPDVDCAGGALPGFVLFGTRKPTFFDMNKRGDPLWSAATGNRGFPDKGFYHSFYPLQMMQKDRDFEQIGELSNVWLYGHELAFDSGQYSSTEKTFSEHMAAAHRGAGGETDRFINRLQFGALIGRASNVVPNDPRRAVPQMPAGLRVFDAFVCDGPGVNYDPFALSPRPVEEFVFANANSFTGRMTPGLININTAPPEVMRTIPHWYKLVHSRLFQVPGVDVLARLPRSHLPESVVSYRERFINNGDETDLGFAPGPDLSNRSVLANVAQMRGERGVESIGELLLLASPGGEIDYGNVGPDYFIDDDAWRIDFPSAGFTGTATAPLQEPFSDDSARFFGAMLSVDRDLPNGACCLGGGFCQDWTRDECESA
ncbi:MAG: hypothetical protein GY715_17190, partial [Planctomycetes bacterium]|nr:hypothetical protein [Planctomycetota bacterium]